MDIASSIQKATEEETLKITEYLYKTTGCVNLCLSGQLALNCLINSEILKQGFFKDIWIQPASTDAGCAVGVAFLIWYKYLNNKRIITDYQDKMKNAFLGPSYSDEEIENFLKSNGIPYKKLDYSVIPKITAELIIKGNIVGWFQARIEFGPRALGSRSILADSRNFQLKDRLNAKVKFREDFRPLAPTVLFEKKDEFFNLNRESPYMLFVAEVKKDKINQIPAVTHIDNSSRIQTIKREQNPLYYDTIYEFYKETGCPVIINTSFNTKDEPIVLTPQDAYRCFMRTEMDYLLMGSFLLDKKEQRPIEKSLF
jgi:carbamoyltransferase